MTGRENVRRTIERLAPHHPPANFEVSLDVLYDKDPHKQARVRELLEGMPREIFMTPGCWMDRWEQENGSAHKYDEWGVEGIDDGHGFITTYHPLAAGYDRMEGYPWPDMAAAGRFAGIDRLLAHPDTADRYRVGKIWFTLWERLWMLRGMENMLTDYIEYPAEFHRLKERVQEINLMVLDQWLERPVDAVFFSDDWGGQHTMLISPDQWRRLFKPAYRRLFAKVHEAGRHVWFHSCGNITAILPDLIELGVDVLNPVQPQSMDLAFLAREYGGHICFNGGIDVQGTMVTGTPEEVKRELQRLVELFGGANGGYIANTSHTIMPETPLDNVIALLEAYQTLI